MKNGDAHLTGELLEEYADGMLTGEPRADAERHLAGCAQCMGRLRVLSAVGASLRSLPLERLEAGFTGMVLERVGAAGASRTLTLAGWMAGVIGLVFVGTVILMVFMATGVIQLQDTSREWTRLQGYWTDGGAWLADGLSTVGRWFGLHQPTSPQVAGVLAAFAVLAGLGLFDRLVGRRFMRGQQGY